MNYFKRHWDETTGEEATDKWGTSTYFFETDNENYPKRQIQVFENGKALKYDREHHDDYYGGLSDQPLEFEEMEPFKIDKSEFENIWTVTHHA